MKKLSLVLLLMLIVIGPVILPNSQVKAATGGYGTVNLAKGKPVTASTNTVRGNPSDVNDGNIDTVWYSSQGNPTNNSFVLDLGAVYSIGRIDMTLAQVWGFAVSTSIDGANYTQRHTSPWSPTTVSAPISIAVDGSYSARHIKYAAFANWPQYVGVQEIEVYEWLASPPPPPPGTYGAVNLALSKTTTLQSGFSLVAGNPPSNAVDGNPATTYAGSSSFRDDANGKYSRHGYISIDLGQSYKIGKIVVHPGAVHYYRIVMSNVSPYPAGSPWLFKDYAAQYGTASTSAEEFTFAINGAYTARYLYILTGTQATPTSVAPQLGEVEVYEWVAGSAAAPASPALAPATPQSKGPVGYWPGEGNANDAAGSRNGTLRNGVTFAPGKVGQAFNLDGVSGYVDLGAWTTGSQWTLAAWVKPSSAPTGRKTMVGALAAFYDWGIVMDEGKLGVATRPLATPPWIVSSGIPATAGTWYYVAGTSDGTTAKIYINGELKGSAPVSPNYQGTSAGLRIGSEVWCNCNNFPGLVDEVRIYNYAQTQSEIQTDMNKASGATPSTPPPAAAPAQAGPVGYWNFNEGSGSVAQDSSGNGNDGSITGATWAPGKFGNALNLDGNADFVKLPHTTVNGLNDITFAAWIKTNSNKDMGIITGANSATDNEFLLFVEGGSLSTTVKNQTFIAKKKINDGSWHFVTVVRTGNTGEVLVYVDGQQDAKNTLIAGKLVIDPNGLWIGRDQDCVGGCWQTEQDFQGSIDEAAIYNRALSQTEIQAAMVTGVAGQPSTTPASTTPVISNVSPVIAAQTQTITISGKGFGSQNAYNGNSAYLTFTDVTAGVWAAGCPGCAVTLNVTSWTDSQIVVSGFTGPYGSSGWVLKPGDQLQIRVWNAPSGAGPTSYSVSVAAVAPPASIPTTPAPKATDASLMAEERTVAPNSAITVPIRLDKADRLGSLNFSLRYDPAVLKVNKAESGDLAGGTLFQANIRDAGIIRFGIVAQGTAGITGDGPVAHVEFTALGARGSQSQLTLGDLNATDTSGAKLGVTLRAGRITIAAKLKGDYDGDGKITAKDSLAALKMSVVELPEDLNLDMDADGKVTAEDARRILAGALGGPVTTSAQPAQPAQPTTALPAPAGAQTPAALPPLVSKTLEPSSAPQLVSYKDEVGLIIPGGTLDSRQTVTISPAPNLPAGLPEVFTQLAAYDISIGNVREFKKPLTIEIAYNPAVIPSDTTPDKALSVGWWDAGQKRWVNAPFILDTIRNVIMIPTTHLTVWEIWAKVKGWKPEETENFVIYYDPNTSFDIEGRKGPAANFAKEVGVSLETAYGVFADAKYNMSLTFIPPTVAGGFIGSAVGGGIGFVTGLWGGGPNGALAAGRAGINAGGIIGAPIGAAAGAIVVGTKTYVILDRDTVSAQWNKNYTGEIYVPLTHTDEVELHHDLAHELFHAVQNGYFSTAESGTVGDLLGTNVHWWNEATADYAPVAHRLSGLARLPKIQPKYFQFPLPEESMEGFNERFYITSRFIDYMVKKKSADYAAKKDIEFKAMWDAVACLACPQRLTDTILKRLETYQAQRQPNLHTLFRDFAAEVFFDSNSPLELAPGKTLKDSGALSKDSTLKPTDSTDLYEFKLPADYTAQLWRIAIGLKDAQTERTLKVMAAAMSEPGKVTVSAFVLPSDQRVPGGVAQKPIPLYSEGGQTANVTVKNNETLYIMAVNSQTKSVDVSVKVTDEEEGLTGDVTVAANPYNMLSTNVLSVTGKWKLTAKGAQLEGKRNDDRTGIIVEAGVPVRLTVTAPATMKTTTWRDPGDVPLRYEIRTATGSPKLGAVVQGVDVKTVSTSTDTIVIDFTLPKNPSVIPQIDVNLYYTVTYKTEIYRTTDNAYRASLSDGLGGRPLEQSSVLLPKLRISTK